MIEERVWLDSYPEGVPADIDASQYESLLGLMADSFAKYANRTAYSFMGQDISYAQTDVKSQALAAYFQSLGLDAQRAAVSCSGSDHFACGLGGGQCEPLVHPART